MAHYILGNTIPEFVRNYRVRNEMTQAELGNVLDIHAQYVSNIERGVMDSPMMFNYRFLSLLDQDEAKYYHDLMTLAREDDIFHKLEQKEKFKKKAN